MRGYPALVVATLFACGAAHAQQQTAGGQRPAPAAQSPAEPATAPARKSLMNAVVAALIHSAEQTARQQKQARDQAGGGPATSAMAAATQTAAPAPQATVPNPAVNGREQLAVESEP